MSNSLLWIIVGSICALMGAPGWALLLVGFLLVIFGII